MSGGREHWTVKAQERAKMVRDISHPLRDDTPADDSDIMPGSEFDGPVIL